MAGLFPFAAVMEAATSPSADPPRIRALLTRHRDLHPDTPLAEWEASLRAYHDLAPLRRLAPDVVFLSGWTALRDMLRNPAPSFDYIIQASPDPRHGAAHHCLTHYATERTDGLDRTGRKQRAMAGVSDVVAAERAALAAWVEACFQRLPARTGAVDLQLEVAIPLALGALAIAHGLPPERPEMIQALFPHLIQMRHLFDFLHHDQAITEADQICDALMATIAQIAAHYRDHPASRGFHAALRARGDRCAHATLAGLNLAGVSTIAETLRWIFWKEVSDPAFLPMLRARGAQRDVALNMLRLYTPQPMAYREYPEGGEIAGEAIAPGSKVFANLNACLRDPRAMTTPEAFAPDNAPFARLVFGGGSRRCAGMAYTVELTHLMLAARARLPGHAVLDFAAQTPTIGMFRDRSAGQIGLSWRG